MAYAPEGAGRNDKIHGDEGMIDIEPYLSRALEDVLDTIMLYGQYPQPSSSMRIKPRRCLFDLMEWIYENRSGEDIRTTYICALVGGTDAVLDAIARDRLEITRELRELLRDSDIVRDLAEELAREDRE